MGGLWSGSKKNDDSKPDRKRQALAKSPFTSAPYVLKRVSSMYFDEDGILAHEFYEEHRVQSREGGSFRRTMILLQHSGIIPQGEIQLCHPRLHVDFPIVLMENV